MRPGPGKSGPGAARTPAAPDRRPGTTGPAPERCRRRSQPGPRPRRPGSPLLIRPPARWTGRNTTPGAAHAGQFAKIASGPRRNGSSPPAGRDRLTVAAAGREGPPPARAGQAERNRPTPGPADRRPGSPTLNYSPRPRTGPPSPPAPARSAPGPAHGKTHKKTAIYLCNTPY